MGIMCNRIRGLKEWSEIPRTLARYTSVALGLSRSVPDAFRELAEKEISSWLAR